MTSSVAHASVDGAPAVLGWDNVATIFRQRYAADAPGRVDIEVAQLKERKDTGLKLDPTLEARYTRDDTDPARTTRSTTVSQGTPFGTSLSAGVNRTSGPDAVTGVVREQETRSLRLKQELLKDGPWHGLAKDDAARLARESAELRAQVAQDDALHAALKAFAQAQGSQQSLLAAEKAVERAEQQHKSVQELVSSGYRARADLLVSEASLIRARQTLLKARQSAETSRRNLLVALYFDPNGPEITRIALDPASAAWLKRLEDVAWPAEPPSVRVARLDADAAETAADLASRADLPSLSVQLSLSRSRDPTTTAVKDAALTRSIEAALSVPIVSAIRRDGAAIAALEADKARSTGNDATRKAAARFTETTAARRVADESLATAEKLFALAERTLVIEQEKYSDGKSTIAEVRRVQDDVDGAQLAVIEARRDHVLSRLDWANAAGGLGSATP